MLLSDKHIKDRINKHKLITNAKTENIRNCAYSLRVGQLIEPDTGALIVDHAGIISAKKGYTVKPNEIIIAMTAETVEMPDDLCATYSPLYRVSKKGMMLLNPSMVEPGYHGPLSCIFLNFSSINVRLNQGDEIAKISFHELIEKPVNLFSYKETKESYESKLANNATFYKKTFLDIENIKNRTVDEVKKQAKGYAIAGGIVVSIILVWSGIQPFIQKPFYKTAGLIERSQRLEETSMIKEIEKDLLRLRKNFELQIKENEIKKLKNGIEGLKTRINNLENK